MPRYSIQYFPILQSFSGIFSSVSNSIRGSAISHHTIHRFTIQGCKIYAEIIKISLHYREKNISTTQLELYFAEQKAETVASC